MYKDDEVIYIKDENDFYSIKSPEKIKKVFFTHECNFEMPNMDKFINLEELSYNYTVLWEYISELRLPYIKKLFFAVYEPKFSGKIEIPTLESLDIRVEKFRNLTPLEILIEANENRDNIDFSGFSNLKELRISRWCNIDLKSLLVLSNLKLLRLDYCQLKDITEIGKMETLEELYLYNNEIENIDPLANLRRLKILRLSYNNIKDVKAIFSLDNLVDLDLFKNNFNSIKDYCVLREKNISKLIITKEDKDEEMKKMELERLSKLCRK